MHTHHAAQCMMGRHYNDPNTFISDMFSQEASTPYESEDSPRVNYTQMSHTNQGHQPRSPRARPSISRPRVGRGNQKRHDKSTLIMHIRTYGVHHQPNEAHMSSSSRSCAACTARGMSDMGARCVREGSSPASKTTSLRMSGRASSPASSSSSRSRSSARPRRCAADRSIGFGRVKMDWPDLSSKHQ